MSANPVVTRKSREAAQQHAQQPRLWVQRDGRASSPSPTRLMLASLLRHGLCRQGLGRRGLGRNCAGEGSSARADSGAACSVWHAVGASSPQQHAQQPRLLVQRDGRAGSPSPTRLMLASLLRHGLCCQGLGRRGFGRNCAREGSSARADSGAACSVWHAVGASSSAAGGLGRQRFGRSSSVA